MSSQARATQLDDELLTLPGVGPKTASRLRAAGLDSLAALARFVPCAYEDRRGRATLTEAEDGAFVVVTAVVRSFRARRFRGRYLAEARLVADGDAAIVARWFHPVGGLDRRACPGEQVIVAGKIKRGRGPAVFVHPELRAPGESPREIAVRYRSVEGVGAATVARLCRAALERLDRGGQLARLDQATPRELLARHGLPPLAAALRRLHAPPAELGEQELKDMSRGTSRAHRRLALDALLPVQLERLLARRRLRAGASPLGPVGEGFGDRERLRAAIPFEPTAGQWRAIAELEEDLAGPRPMLRLLQGDVGSGKTVVAFAACLDVIAAGGQAAFMVPTELLAAQHARTLAPWCARAGVRLASLTASSRARERAALVERLAAGEIDLVVGTHAILTGDVAFACLGLAVVDEQHRFGVEQRARLRAKGGAPHLLVMTATPIPRSLALTAFGELDITTIEGRLPGRVPPQTRLFTGAAGLVAARRELARRVLAGARAFVVCPRIDERGAIAGTDVAGTAAALRELLPGRVVAELHGRCGADEREAIMGRFHAGEIAALVATTVIEVGVDVAGARVMLVEHAEHFGLAQLHQLRGRVGRAGGASLCLLHTASPRASPAGDRLAALAEEDDGFAVAERDLELRGPGEVFGTRQAGAPGLFASALAGDAAALLAADPRLERHPELARAVRARAQAIDAG